MPVGVRISPRSKRLLAPIKAKRPHRQANVLGMISRWNSEPKEIIYRSASSSIDKSTDNREMIDTSDAVDEQVQEQCDELLAGNVPIRDALHRLRVLDLTGLNRLLNFKHSAGKSLQSVQSSPEAVFLRLVESNNGGKIAITPVPDPDRSSWVTKNGRLTRPGVRDYTTSLGIDISYDLGHTNRRLPVGFNTGAQLRALCFAEDLGKHCRKIEREARLAIEETGANMLYLVFGFLEYPDAKDGDRIFQAPLICVPVKMEKIEGGQYPTLNLSFTERS